MLITIVSHLYWRVKSFFITCNNAMQKKKKKIVIPGLIISTCTCVYAFIQLWEGTRCMYSNFYCTQDFIYEGMPDFMRRQINRSSISWIVPRCNRLTNVEKNVFFKDSATKIRRRLVQVSHTILMSSLGTGNFTKCRDKYIC